MITLTSKMDNQFSSNYRFFYYYCLVEMAKCMSSAFQDDLLKFSSLDISIILLRLKIAICCMDGFWGVRKTKQINAFATCNSPSLLASLN